LLPDTYDALHAQRIATELNRTDEVTTTTFVEVPTVRLQDVLHARNITRVDVLSIDTENSELAVLQGLDLGIITIDVAVVEDAYAGQSWSLYELLSANGFMLHSVLDFDTIFVRRDAWLRDFGMGTRLAFEVVQK
jgi:hypothetical protein